MTQELHATNRETPLGLSSHALAVFGLLKSGPMSTQQLVEELPSVDVQVALKELAAVRLVRTAGHREAFVATPPHMAAEESLRAQESAASSRLAELAHRRSEYAQLAAMFDVNQRTRYTSLAEIVEGSAEGQERIVELKATATRSVWATHATLLPPDELAAIRRYDENYAERGLEIREMYLHSARRHQLHAQHLRAIDAAGCHVRTRSQIPFSLLVIDSDTAVVPRPGGEPGVAVLRDPVTAGFVAHVFESFWLDAIVPTWSDSEADESVAEEIVIAIMRELARGHTDEAIARRLGISTRTIRRYLSKVAEEYNAQTRYQLGMVAHRYFDIAAPGLDE